MLRSNLANMSDARLNSAAVQGLLSELHGRAVLVGNPAKMASSQNKPELIQSGILENDVAYLRVGEVGKELADQVNTAYQRLAATNKIAGVALDLRFAGGHDYAAAVATTDLFATKEMPLLKWDKEMEESHPVKQRISGPLMVLINGGTTGAAEALAAALREAGAGLIIGDTTAGLALTMREFPLKNGESLRIATNPVKLGNGQTISSVSPDIRVSVSREDEQEYVKNPYAKLGENASSAGVDTNDFLAVVDHTSEADLVRQKLQNGEDAGATAPPRKTDQEKPVIQDPVLARALDLIKGLAIVHEDRL